MPFYPCDKALQNIRKEVEKLRNICEESNSIAGQSYHQILDECLESLGKINICNDADNPKPAH